MKITWYEVGDREWRTGGPNHFAYIRPFAMGWKLSISMQKEGQYEHFDFTRLDRAKEFVSDLFEDF